ncbi:MAG: diguanylate cyclase [Chloroflexi bacterium]|nr:diguanylate cyclase [Chloroflexota bacterium]
MREPFRVLVVDDFSPVRNIIAVRLAAQGYEVLTAENGQQGLAVARREHPDIVIVDWTVPGLGGIELIRQLKADQSLESTYIILLIGRLGVEDKVQALEVGADEYMEKPVNDAELGARLRAAARIICAKRRLEALARTDGLTGVANQRAFHETLAREVARAARYDRPLSLLVMDVDDFKLVNDEYGHLVGDIVLKLVASFLVAYCRTSDTVARLGGDEFAVILPETDADGAQATIARLNSLLEKEWRGNSMPGQSIYNLTVKDSQGQLPNCSLHLSMGWATSGPGATLSANELVHLADRRMYEQKRGPKAGGEEADEVPFTGAP